jgi:hypothetical protein
VFSLNETFSSRPSRTSQTGQNKENWEQTQGAGERPRGQEIWSVWPGEKANIRRHRERESERAGHRGQEFRNVWTIVGTIIANSAKQG